MGVKGQGLGRPLDPVEDFNTPTTLPGSPAEEQVGRSEEEEAQEFAEAVALPREERQATLPGTETAPDTPQVIRNKQMLVKLVETKLIRDKNDAPLLRFKFSFMLTPEHEEYLPSEVVAAWNIVKQGHCNRYDITEVPPQTLTVNLVPDDESTPPDLKLVSAIIDKPSVEVIEESGSGKNKTGIRFSFYIIIDRDPDPLDFGCKHDGDAVWIAMGDTQLNLTGAASG